MNNSQIQLLSDRVTIQTGKKKNNQLFLSVREDSPLYAASEIV